MLWGVWGERKRERAGHDRKAYYFIIIIAICIAIPRGGGGGGGGGVGGWGPLRRRELFLQCIIKRNVQGSHSDLGLPVVHQQFSERQDDRSRFTPNHRNMSRNPI